jgi:hypothetical protein
MIYKRPLRLTILHLAHRFLMDDDTFITTCSLSLQFYRHHRQTKTVIIPGLAACVQIYGKVNITGSLSVTATECSK